MATRIQKVKECDRAMCRRRKGVAWYSISMLEMPTVRFEDGTEVCCASGELCPAHVEMVKHFIDDLFKNKKEYNDDPEPADPTDRS